MRRTPLLLIAVTACAGCASTPTGPMAPGGVEQTSLGLPRTAAKAPRRRPRDGGVGPQPVAAGDPYAKRPGATERAKQPPPTVTFDAPAEAERAPAQRSRPLPSPARLAVAFVREGKVQHDGEALLAFASSLTKDTALASILRLGDQSGPSASLATLAKAAKAAKADLLLVEIRGQAGAAREAYLLTAEGLLVARYEGDGQRPIRVDSRGEEALVARIGQALARLKP